jgi:hypothetical protein
MSDRVYVSNYGNHDYTKAERFGELHPVTKYRVDIMHTDRLIGEIEEALAEAKESDHLLVSGNPAITAICVFIWLAKFKEVNLLFWDALYQDYMPRKLNEESLNGNSGGNQDARQHDDGGLG